MEKQVLNRRSVIKLAALGSVAGSSIAVTLNSAMAADSAAGGQFAGSVYFTPENPGRWKGKENSHMPAVKVEKKEDGQRITVTTAHEMKGFEHYIVKHLLIDKNFNVISEKMFNPMKELQAKSLFELTGEAYSGTLYAVSVCNKHDAWISSVEV